MKLRNLFLTFLLLTVFIPLHATKAQYTTPGCYISYSGIYSRVGDTVNGTCTQGSPLGDNGIPGATVKNNLSYTPLEPIPGQAGAPADFCSLLNTLFKVLIYLGGMIAVLFLVLGGITYMVSDVVDKRSAARERIKSAVVGLLILLGAYIILYTVNPNLVNACNVLGPTKTGIYYPPAPVSTTQSLRRDCTDPNGKNGVILTYNMQNAACAGAVGPGQVGVVRPELEFRAPSGFNKCSYVGPGELCYYK